MQNQQYPIVPALPQGATQRIQIPLSGTTGGYIGQQIDPAVTINMYNVLLDGLTTPALVSIPGSKTVYTHPIGQNVRGMFQTGKLLFVVYGNELVVYENNLLSFQVFTINTNDGRVNFCATNSGQIMLVDGVDGWCYTVGVIPTFNQIVDATFVGFNSPVDCAYLDGHVFVVFSSGNIFLMSNLEDCTTYNGLNQAKLTSAGNQLLAGIKVISSRLFIFGQSVTEIWYPTGQASLFPFQRDSNSTVEWGVVSNATITVGTVQIKSMYRIFPDVENIIIWLGQQPQGSPKIVMSFMGDTSVISDPATEYKIQKLSVIDDAVAYMTTINGHVFYTITFVTGNLTLVYDFDMKIWHQQEMINGDYYFAGAHAMFNNVHYVGWINAPKISELSDEYLSNDTEDLHCVRVTQMLTLPTYERLSVPRFDLDMRKGTGKKTTDSPESGQPKDFNINPLVYLSHSMNGGYTFSQPRAVTSGAVGQADWKVVWTGFPVSQRHNFKIETFNQTKTILIDASMQIQNMGY